MPLDERGVAEEQEAIGRRLQLIDKLQLKVKRKTDFISRRILSSDELEYLECALISLC